MAIFIFQRLSKKIFSIFLLIFAFLIEVPAQSQNHKIICDTDGSYIPCPLIPMVNGEFNTIPKIPKLAFTAQKKVASKNQ